MNDEMRPADQDNSEQQQKGLCEMLPGPPTFDSRRAIDRSIWPKKPRNKESEQGSRGLTSQPDTSQ